MVISSQEEIGILWSLLLFEENTKCKKGINFIFYFKYMLLPKYKVAFLVSYFFHLNILDINLFYIYSVFFIIIEQFIFVKIDKDIK